METHKNAEMPRNNAHIFFFPGENLGKSHDLVVQLTQPEEALLMASEMCLTCDHTLDGSENLFGRFALKRHNSPKHRGSQIPVLGRESLAVRGQHNLDLSWRR